MPSRKHVAAIAAIFVAGAVGYLVLRDVRPTAPPRSAGAPPEASESVPPLPAAPFKAERGRPLPPPHVQRFDAAAERTVADQLVKEAQALPPEELARARELLRDALDVDPKNTGALRALARTRLEDEDNAEAEALALRCLEATPGDRECESVRLLAKAREGRVDAEETELCYREHATEYVCVALLTNLRLRQRRLDDVKRLLDEMRDSSRGGRREDHVRGDARRAAG